MKYDREKLIGKKFEKFTVIAISETPHKVIATCECGAKREIFSSNLVRGRHYSCGSKECRKPHKTNLGNAEWQRLGKMSR